MKLLSSKEGPRVNIESDSKLGSREGKVSKELKVYGSRKKRQETHKL